MQPSVLSQPAPNVVVPQSQPTQPTGNQPNWLEKLLPTAGGILGSIGGSFVSPILGSAAGGAAGGALGKDIENKLTGETGGVGTSAIENAIGGGAGGIIGKLGTGVAGLISGGAEKGASRLLAGQFGKELDPDVVSDLLTNHGITDAGQTTKIAKVLTGATDSDEGQALINKTVENGIAKNTPNTVDISDLLPYTAKGGQLNAISGTTLDNLIGQAQGLRPNDLTGANGILKFISQNSSALEPDVNGGVAAVSDAPEKSALGLSRTMANKGASMYEQAGKAGPLSDSYRAMGKFFNDYANEINDRIGFNTTPVTQEEKDSLIGDIQKHVGPINSKSAQATANEVQKSQTLGDLRNVQSKWVRANQALQKVGNKAKANFGTTTRDMATATFPLTGAVAAGKPGALAGLAGMATKSPVADKIGTGVLSDLSKVTGSKTAKTMIPILSKMGAIATTNLPNLVSQPSQTNVSSMGGPTTPGETPMTPQAGMQPMQGAPQSQYSDIINQMLRASQLDPFQASAYTGVLNTVMPQLQKATTEQGLLSSLPGLMQNAGGGQGLGGGGIMDTILSKIPGTPQYTAINASNNLGSMLGLQGLTPNFLQTPQTQGLQLQTMQNILSGLQ